MAPSLLWFATIQCIESKQDPAGLAPKGGFVPAKPVERIAGQIGEAQKATREVSAGNHGRFDQLRPRAGPGFRCASYAVRCRIAIEIDQFSGPEHRMDEFSGGRLNLVALPELAQTISLDFEQASFHCVGPPQSPQQAG